MSRYNIGDKVRVEQTYFGIVKDFLGDGLYIVQIPELINTFVWSELLGSYIKRKGFYYMFARDLRLIERSKTL